MSQKEDELERKKGDWSSHDNKRYIGKIDRVFVSLGEKWEVEYFIDHWLETRGSAISNGNRDKVAAALEQHRGRTPYRRDELNTYLDVHFRTRPKAGAR